MTAIKAGLRTITLRAALFAAGGACAFKLQAVGPPDARPGRCFELDSTTSPMDSTERERVTALDPACWHEPR